MFGLSKREQRWKEQQEAAKLLIPFITSLAQTKSQEYIAKTMSEEKDKTILRLQDKISQQEEIIKNLENLNLILKKEVKAPLMMNIPPAPVEMSEVIYTEGWNAACEAYFGGLPPPEPLVITVTLGEKIPLDHRQVKSVIASTAYNFDAVDIVRATEHAHGIVDKI